MNALLPPISPPPSTLPTPSPTPPTAASSPTLSPATNHLPFTTPIWAPGKEPLPVGLSEADRPLWEQNKRMERYMSTAMESCIVKTALAGGAGGVHSVSYIRRASILTTIKGFALGSFFSLMSSSFAYEDPYLRSQSTLNNTQKARQIFKEMGRGMWSSGKSFGKIGALFAGFECVIESVSLIALFVVCPC